MIHNELGVELRFTMS